MGKKIIMIGNGSYSQTLMYYIDSIEDWEIVAYADESQHEVGEIFNGLPILSVGNLAKAYPPHSYDLVMGVGYLNMNENRKRIFLNLKSSGYKFLNIIHPTAILNNAKIGEGNVILENVVVEPNTVIGDNSIIWSSVLIGHNVTIESHNHLAACSLMAGNTYLEECCFLGNHSTIKDGIKIAHHTLIGAGAYV